MNGAEVLRRLWNERRQWKSYLSGASSNEVNWTLRGIDLCIAHVKEVIKERRVVDAVRRPRINRWLAGELYHAIQMALRNIKRCDRGSAERILEKAIERVEEERHE